MILYTNGCSHVAAGEAVNEFCFAEDDSLYYALGRQPHPDNLAASFSAILANSLGAILDCNAEAAASNDRILRTTNEYIDNQHDEDFVVLIGWTTWEREEWKHKNDYLQITAGGTDSVPESMAEEYREWVLKQTMQELKRKELKWNQLISAFSDELTEQDIKHIFFHTQEYTEYLLKQGFATTNNHFGEDGHRAWASRLVPIADKMFHTNNANTGLTKSKKRTILSKVKQEFRGFTR